MLPVLFEFDTWRIRSYDVVLLLSILTGLWFMYRSGRRKGLAGKNLFWLFIGMTVFALLGARINGWFFWYSAQPDLLSFNIADSRHGMTAFGGISGAVVFAMGYSRLNRWNPWTLLDLTAPTLVVCEGIQRIGCLMNGCCYGKPTHHAFGFYLPDILGVWTDRYPSQIMTAIFCLILFFYLQKYKTSMLNPGDVFLLYLILYPSGRLVLDFMRGDEPLAFGILTAHQAASMIMALLGALLITLRWMRMTEPITR